MTLKEIAKASGVSTATVSYVVNGGPKSVSDATRTKVQKIIDELGYKPNAAARSLKGFRTATLGVVFPHEGIEPFENGYFSESFHGILQVASERKQVLMLFTGMNWGEVEKNVPSFCDGRCDGFIFLAPPANSQFVVDLANRNKNVMLLGTRAGGIPVSAVDADNVQGGRLAARYLIDLGHRKLAMITSSDDDESSNQRLEGFRKGMEESGIELGEPIIIIGNYAPKGSHEAAKELLARKKETGLTAVFCGNDAIAETVLQLAPELGVRVPEDLSVIGFDDLRESVNLNPPLTTIHHPLRLIGASAATGLLDLIEDPRLQPKERLFEVHVVERASTARFTPAL